MLKQLKIDDEMEILCSKEWLSSFKLDFRKRFVNLLSFAFQTLPSSLSLSILDSVSSTKSALTKEILEIYFTPFDIKRLDSYSRNLIDYHVILDMIPSVANLFFQDRLDISLSAGQKSILLGIGLQHKSVDKLTVTFLFASTILWN